MSAPRRWVIGLDVGGTKIAGGLLDPITGETAAACQAPTRPDRGGAAVLADVVTLAETLADAARARSGVAAAIGLGVCELVDPTGRVTSAQTIDWIDVPVQTRLATIAPTTIEADVRAAALAEASFGAGAGFQIWLYITIGTGIASAIVLDGRPLVGAHGAALVLATGPLTLPCPHCGALEPVVLEGYASGSAIARRYAATGIVCDRAEPVLHAAAAGDPAASAIVASAAIALGSAIGWLANV
ncbi:MAG: ROK family protein, partial [Thermomicrobiales bacterium]|nr:ROK family protein [Thermomicrobiales bacterium]